MKTSRLFKTMAVVLTLSLAGAPAMAQVRNAVKKETTVPKSQVKPEMKMLREINSKEFKTKMDALKDVRIVDTGHGIIIVRPGSSGEKEYKFTDAEKNNLEFLKRWHTENCGNNSYYASPEAAAAAMPSGYRAPTEKEFQRLSTDFYTLQGSKDGRKGVWFGVNETLLAAAVQNGDKTAQKYCLFLPFDGYKGGYDNVIELGIKCYYMTSTVDNNMRCFFIIHVPSGHSSNVLGWGATSGGIEGSIRPIRK